MEFSLPIAVRPAGLQPRTYLTPSDQPGLFEHLADHFIPHARNDYQPHVLGGRLTGLLSAFLVVFKILSIAVLAWGPVVPAFSSAISVANIISLTNQSRQGQGLGSLTENGLLDQAAQTKANDMLAKGYFSHNTPDGKTPWDFINAAGYNYVAAGENLAINFTQAENVEDAWMNSPGHRANILNKTYEDIGIGISEGLYQGHDAIFVVQMFGTLAAEQIALSDQPTPVQTQVVPQPAKPAVVPVKPTPSPATPPALMPAAVSQPVLSLSSPAISVAGNTLVIHAEAANAVKVLALFGQGGVMLQPTSDTSWQGTINLSNLAANNSTVLVKAYDIFGNVKTEQVAEFSGSTPANYALMPQVKGAHVISFAGLSFNPAVTEKQFYLFFIAAMLASLALAIGIKRHVQHVNLVANGAFTVLLAVFLLLR